jgi:hypothetical protein
MGPAQLPVTLFPLRRQGNSQLVIAGHTKGVANADARPPYSAATFAIGLFGCVVQLA